MTETGFRASAAFFICASFSTPAFAYLDPATGSILLQALIGVVASWVMYSKLFASKAKDFFVRLTKKAQPPESE